MEIETIAMTPRKRILLKPLSKSVTSQIKEFRERDNSTNAQNANVPIQPLTTTTPLPLPHTTPLASPTNEKKRILIQDIDTSVTPTVQRNKVLLPVSFISDDSDSDDDSTINDVLPKETKKSNVKLYCSIALFLFWVAVQYWMIVVAEFGAVFFAISALIAIYYSTTKIKKNPNILSAYSVFNPQCKPIQGSADPKQLEREFIFGGL